MTSPMIFETHIEKVVAENVLKEVKLLDAHMNKLLNDIALLKERRYKLEQHAAIEGIELPATNFHILEDARD